jgi:hypothetical protein
MAALVSVDTTLLRRRVIELAVVVFGAVLAFAASRGDLGRPVVWLAALVAVALAALAVRYPVPAACTALAAVLVVPIYWAQPLPMLPLAATPAALTGVLLLPAAIAARDRLRFTLLDGLVLIYFALAAASIGANVDGTAAALADLAARTVVPYVAFRLLATHVDAVPRLAVALVASGAVLAIVGIREADGNGNPFFTLVRSGFEGGQWVRSQVRFGAVRAEASFGHAIAFSLFLAVALLLVLGLAWRVRGGRRVALLAVAAVLGSALLATGSRGGVVSLVIGALLWAVTLRGKRSGLLVVAGVVAGVLLLTPAGDQVVRLRDSVTATGEAGDAARYRLEIARIATDDRMFSVLGQEAPPDLGVVAAAKEQLGLRTIDSQYALVYVTSGVAGLAAFAAIGLALLGVTLRRRLDPVERAWAAGTAATAVALLSVALFTQMLTLYWIAIAVTAAAAQRHPVDE